MPNRQRPGVGSAMPQTFHSHQVPYGTVPILDSANGLARLIQERFLCRTKVPGFFRFALTKDVYQQLPPPRLALPHDRHGRPYEAADERSALASRRQRQDNGGSRAAD